MKYWVRAFRLLGRDYSIVFVPSHWSIGAQRDNQLGLIAVHVGPLTLCIDMGCAHGSH